LASRVVVKAFQMLAVQPQLFEVRTDIEAVSTPT